MIFESILGPIGPLPENNAVSGLFEYSKYQNDPINSDRDLYVDAGTGNSITFREFKAGVPRVAGYLQTVLGLNKGDCVALFMPNNLYIPFLHMGILSLGGVVSPANVMYSAEELAHQFRVAQPKVAIVSDLLVKTADEAGKLAGIDVSVVPLSTAIKGMDSALKAKSTLEIYPVSVNGKTTPAYYCFSSGTSGLAKGVVTTHYNILSNVIQVYRVDSRLHGPDFGVSCVLPMSHIFALNTGVWSGPINGNKTVIFSKFDVTEFVENVVKYKLNLLYLVPPIVLLLGKLPILNQYPEFNECVKTVVSGAAPISKETIELFNSKCPNAEVVQGYGLTETTPVTHAGFAKTAFPYDADSIGWLVPGAKAKLVDYDSGKPVEGYNQRGELWVQGPMVMQGYLNNHEATTNAFSDDKLWFKTGDVAVVKENQQFYIVDRIKELIKSNGHQVAPAELESLLLTHPNVADAAVIGVLNQDKTSENPRAYVVLGSDVDPLSIYQWFNAKVAKHKRLWGGLVVLKEIPKSPSGKIQRNVLRQRQNDVLVGAKASL